MDRVAACMWRLRRLYRIEAGIFAHESLTIELDRARDEAQSYDEFEDEFALASLTEGHVHITDEERHGQATARAEKTVRLLLEESLALGVAFRQDAENAGAISKLSRYEAAIERSLYRAASKRPDRTANHLRLLLSMSPWTAPTERLIVTIRLEPIL